MCIAVFSSIAVHAQSSRVTGLVTDGPGGSVLSGVSILIDNKPNSVTDQEGKFSLVASKGSVLTFTSVGMVNVNYTLKGETFLKIVMESDDKALSEVVVIGYGTIKKRDLTGAVSQVKADDILKGSAVSSINQALQGRIAGVQVNQNDGAPGAGISIQIRGANSNTTSSDPLYVVDGIPYISTAMPSSSSNVMSGMHQSTNPIASINPQDVESIEVLKDASATAIYGSRGANGVVLITTKQGKAGRDKVEFSSSSGVSKVVKQIDMLNAFDYANYMNEQKINQSTYEGTPLGTLPYPGAETEKGYIPSPEDYLSGAYPVTNWQDQIFQSAFSQTYNLATRGGSDKGSHSFSGNILDEKGIIYGSGFKRYSFRGNISRKTHDWLEIGTNMSFTNSLNKMSKTSASDNSVIKGALFYPPTRGVIDPNDDQQINWFAANPFLYVRSAKDWISTNNFFSSSYAQVSFLKDFTLRQNVGFSYYGAARNVYYNRETNEGKDPINGFGMQGDNYAVNSTFETILSYNKEINKDQRLNVMLASTYENGYYGNKSMSGQSFPTDITEENDMAAAVKEISITSGKGETSLMSFLGRVNYSLFDKYLITGSFRRDGSSKFHKSNRWSTFLSAAIAWRLSEEQFIKDLNIFNDLKLRASYGETGNQGISAYATRDKYTVANYPVNGSLQSGMGNVVWEGPANPNLRWETTSQVDFGLDFSIWNNRLGFIVDYYNKTTRDLLQRVQIPSSTGFSNQVTNFGVINNRGLELSTNIKAVSNETFGLDILANISFNRNKISGLPNDQYAAQLWNDADQAFIQRNGEALGAIYGYVEDGFYDSEAEVRFDPYYANESNAVVRSKIGEIKYKNIDADPTITPHDRQIIGNVNPNYVYGLTTNFRYKKLSLGLFFQGTQGNDIFNGNLFDIKMMSLNNITQQIYNGRWTSENRDIAKWPKAYGGYSRHLRLSDRYVEDGSYFRLKNVNVSYVFNNLIKYVETLSITGSVSNLFTISNYSWYDPDVNAFGGDSSRRGIDLYSYPSSRTFTLGVQCTF